MRYVTRDGHEYVIESPGGLFLLSDGEAGIVVLRPEQVVAVCDLCEEPEDDPVGDPLAEFWDPDVEASVVAHGQCGLDRGLELA